MTDGVESAASSTTSSSRAPPRAGAGRDVHAHPDPARGGITNRNFLIAAERHEPTAASSGWPATTRTCWGSAARSSIAATVAAAGVGVGPEVTAFIRPEGYLVTRFIEGSPVSDAAIHRPETIRRVGRLDPARPRRPGDPGPVHPAPDRRGVSRAGASPGACRSRPNTTSAGRSAGASSWPSWPIRSSCGRATTTCSTPTSSTTGRASGSSTGSTPGWATRSSTSATSASTTSSAPDEDRGCSRPTTGEPARPDRLARITLMRVVSDFREAMWGVLQQGDQHPRRRLRRLRRASTSSGSCPGASTPAFERALREAAGD